MAVANFLLLFALAGAHLPSEPLGEQLVIVTAKAAKPAIQRILQADNMDVKALPAAEVAERMADIPRGTAPLEFWTAYRAHVNAWKDYAAAQARSRSRIIDTTDTSMAGGQALLNASLRINSTFDAVEAIARRYGAWPPRSQTKL